jgi:hypothetical protein
LITTTKSPLNELKPQLDPYGTETLTLEKVLTRRNRVLAMEGKTYWNLGTNFIILGFL